MCRCKPSAGVSPPASPSVQQEGDMAWKRFPEQICAGWYLLSFFWLPRTCWCSRANAIVTCGPTIRLLADLNHPGCSRRGWSQNVIYLSDSCRNSAGIGNGGCDVTCDVEKQRWFFVWFFWFFGWNWRNDLFVLLYKKMFLVFRCCHLLLSLRVSQMFVVKGRIHKCEAWISSYFFKWYCTVWLIKHSNFIRQFVPHSSTSYLKISWNVINFILRILCPVDDVIRQTFFSTSIFRFFFS